MAIYIHCAKSVLARKVTSSILGGLNVIEIPGSMMYMNQLGVVNDIAQLDSNVYSKEYVAILTVLYKKNGAVS